jgi:hypothetical protein
VLLSSATAELVREGLPAAAGLRDLGEHRLKDLQRPERLFQVVAPGLAPDFPESFPNNLPAAGFGYFSSASLRPSRANFRLAPLVALLSSITTPLSFWRAVASTPLTAVPPTPAA